MSVKNSDKLEKEDFLKHLLLIKEEKLEYKEKIERNIEDIKHKIYIIGEKHPKIYVLNSEIDILLTILTPLNNSLIELDTIIEIYRKYIIKTIS